MDTVNICAIAGVHCDGWPLLTGDPWWSDRKGSIGDEEHSF